MLWGKTKPKEIVCEPHPTRLILGIKIAQTSAEDKIILEPDGAETKLHKQHTGGRTYTMQHNRADLINKF